MTTTVLSRRRFGERGMATAEYAVGTAGAVCIACVLMKLGADGWNGWITDIFDQLRLIGGWLDIWTMPWRGPR